MRRTRHVMLPVRSWQYIGLLVVSLACLTLGLVSRDREGHAGSLAGPELEHRAPHEVDACPNLNPLVKSVSCSTAEQPQTKTFERTSAETRISGRSLTPNDLRISRSFSLDRVSRIRDAGSRAYSRIDVRRGRSLDRGSPRTERRQPVDSLRQRVTPQNDRFDIRDRKSRSLERREDRGTFERARETEFRNRQNRLEAREHRRSRSLDRRESGSFERREIRDVVRNRVLAHRRDSFNHQIPRTSLRDARSRSLNRRQSTDLDRRVNREDTSNRRTLESRELLERVNRRAEILDRRTRSITIRETGRMERRVNRGREIERETSRQERRSIARRDIDNESRREARNRYNVIETERRVRSADQSNNVNRRSRISRRSELSRDDRSNLWENRRDVRRSMDERRASGYSITLRGKVDRTAQRNNLRASNERELERASRSLDRRTSENRDNYARDARERRETNRASRVNEVSRDKDSLLRSKERHTLTARRERYLSRANSDRRNSRVQSTRLGRDSTPEADRRSLTKLEQRESRNVERRERFDRFDRQSERTVQRPWSKRQESSFSRNARSERQENTYRLLLTHEPRESRRIGLAAEAARRISKRNTLANGPRSESLENRSAIQSFSRDQRRTNNRLEDRALQRRNLNGRTDVNRIHRTRSVLSDNDIRLIRKENNRVRIMDTQRSRSAKSSVLIPSTERDSPNRRSSDASGRRFSESSVLRRSIRVSRLSRVSEEKGFRENRYHEDTRERMTYGRARGKDIISRVRYTDTLNFPKKEDSSAYDLPFEIMRQALIIGLCTVYGLATINNKGSIIGNIARWTPRLMVW